MDRNLIAALTIVLGAITPAAMIGRFSTEAMRSLGRNPESGPAISANRKGGGLWKGFNHWESIFPS